MAQEDRWREIARRALLSAERLYQEGDFRGCANRAYYAAYQAATGASVKHGDQNQFPAGWNNPAHDQLPELIQNNGDLAVSTRRRVSTHLIALRSTREDADYRPGRTVDKEIALNRVQRAKQVLELLGE